MLSIVRTNDPKLSAKELIVSIQTDTFTAISPVHVPMLSHGNLYIFYEVANS